MDAHPFPSFPSCALSNPILGISEASSPFLPPICIWASYRLRPCLGLENCSGIPSQDGEGRGLRGLQTGVLILLCTAVYLEN